MSRRVLPQRAAKKSVQYHIYSDKQEECLHLDSETGEKLCEICGEPLSSSVEGDRPIKCRTCKLQVHKACILYSGKDESFECDLCKAKLKTAPKCEFCPIHTLRSMKQNSKDKSKWAHISCIMFMPGVSMDSRNKMYTSKDNEELFERKCMYCKTREGAVVYCQNSKCYASFHILCGRMKKCVLGWDEDEDKTTIFCPKHSTTTYSNINCELCGKTGKEERLLLCDDCDKGFHMDCLDPPLSSIPEGNWFCPFCTAKKVENGEVAVIKKGNKEETVDMSVEYIQELDSKQQKNKKEYSNTQQAIQDDDDDEDDDGVSFYESKRTKRTSKKRKAEEVQLTESAVKKTKKKKSDDEEEEEEVIHLNSSEVASLLLKCPVKHLERGKLQRFHLQKEFTVWKTQLLCGFNILLTGFGSKYALLSEFIKRALEHEKCLVVHGFDASFKLTEFLHVIMSNSFHINTDGMKQETLMQECLNQVHSMKEHTFIVIHSIDGEGLANKGILEFFSQLCDTPKCHIIASIDHIRSPLLFSTSMINHFHFLVHDATTFEPYFYEKIHTSQSHSTTGGKSSSGLHYVLSSLTVNHLRILQLLSRETTSTKEGIPFVSLYELCLSEMLVSSEKSLHLILKELEDHELIKKVVSSANPQENYVCIVSAKELKAFCSNLYFVC